MYRVRGGGDGGGGVVNDDDGDMVRRVLGAHLRLLC